MNKKVGAVAFSGSSIVAAVYVQLLDLPIYTENILVMKNAASKTDTTAKVDLYSQNLAFYTVDSFPIALLPLSTYNYLIVHSEGLIR